MKNEMKDARLEMSKADVDIAKQVGEAVQHETKVALTVLGVDFRKDNIDKQMEYLDVRMSSEIVDNKEINLPKNSRLLIFKHDKLEYIIWIKYVSLKGRLNVSVETEIISNNLVV